MAELAGVAHVAATPPEVTTDLEEAGLALATRVAPLQPVVAHFTIHAMIIRHVLLPLGIILVVVEVLGLVDWHGGKQVCNLWKSTEELLW